MWLSWFFLVFFVLVFLSVLVFSGFLGVPGTWSFCDLYLNYIHSDQKNGDQDYVNEMGYFCDSRFDRNV